VDIPPDKNESQMKTWTYITILTLLISCGTKHPDQDFPKINNQTIQTISKVVIEKICADTNLHLDHPLLISDSLYRFHLAKNPDMVSEKDFLNYLMTDARFIDTIPFSKKDSSFLVAQEKHIASIKLDSNACARLQPTKDLEMTQDNYLKQNKFYMGGFFNISIPVFSTDLNTAVLTVEFNGFHIASYYKQVYVLKQSNGSWKILRTKSIAMA
jgi:hypothetical protein